MEVDPIKAISAEVESAAAADNIGMFTVKTANRTLTDASKRPNPDSLYHELWYEGEVCCLFSDSNLGKSIYAVQMAEEIAITQNVLLVDCELSDKQFQMRYTDSDTGLLHPFPDGLFRAEINPMSLDVKDYEEKILAHIEQAKHKLQCKVAIIDNLTYLCNSSDKGVDAGIFMMKLMNLKKQYGWSLLIMAHTPKRSLTSPITQNDLAGSKKLYNFFDSVFAIGKSAKDTRLRYVKQLKVRAGEFRYDSDNVWCTRSSRPTAMSTSSSGNSRQNTTTSASPTSRTIRPRTRTSRNCWTRGNPTARSLESWASASPWSARSLPV